MCVLFLYERVSPYMCIVFFECVSRIYVYGWMSQVVSPIFTQGNPIYHPCQ